MSKPTPTPSLHKVLRLSDLVLYGVGGTVGAGIFVSIGIGAVQAGPALCLSFLLAAAACAVSGLCFSEMASRVPVTGSSYAYTLAVLGRFPAFLIGSILVLDSVISAAACARAWSAYLCIIFPILSPLSEYHLFSNFLSFSLLAGLVCISLGLLMSTGIRETTFFNNISTVLNMIVLSVFVVAGWVLFNGANYSPFAPNGFDGIVKGSGRIFFAFLGFDVINCLVEETEGEGSSRSTTLVPRAILYTIILTTLVYLLVCVSFIGLSPISSIDLSSPLSSALSVRGESSLAFLVGIGAVGNTLTSILSNFLVQPRIVMKMANDGFLPPWFGTVDTTRGVPRNALLVSVGLSALTAFFIDFETLADMVSVASLVSLSVVCICSVISRQRNLLLNSRGSTVDELTPISPTSVAREHSFADSHLWKIALGIYLAFAVVMAVLLLHTSPSTTVFLLVLTATIVSYLFACLELSKMFKPDDNDTRVFRVPFSPYLPLFGVFVNTYMLVGLPMLALIRAACVFGICAVFYFAKVWRNKLVIPAPTKSATQYDSMEISSPATD